MFKTNLARSASAVALVCGLAYQPAVGFAQEESANDDIIVVTATRREGTVQEVPINIAAVNSVQIEEQGFTELADFLSYVPGINIVDRGGRQGNPLIVRGLNADPLGSGDGNNDGGETVATYLGDIPVYVDFKLNDIERVEVLLGPQGTLYGSGTLGGAIRYIPKRPQFDEDTLSVRAETYKYDDAGNASYDIGLTFNKSISDTFAIRGSLDFLDDSGFIDYPYTVQDIGVSNPDADFSDPGSIAANLRRVEDADGEQALSARIAARWQPTDTLDVNLTYYRQEVEVEGRQISQARLPSLNLGKYESGKRVEEPNEINNELLALEVVADLGFAELTSATGFSEFSDDGQRDQTDLLITLEYSYELFPAFTSFTREVGEEDRFNQELRLVSTHDGPFNWIVGGFYNKLRTFGSSSEFVPGYDTYAVNVLGFGFLNDRADNLEYFSYSNDRLVEKAIFGEVGVELFDRLNLTFGGRYYDYKFEEVAAQEFPLFDASFQPFTLDQIRDFDFDPDLGQSDSGFLFKVNASYQLSDDILVYGTVSEGYRIGGSNGVAPCPTFDPNTPDTQGACALAPGQEFSPGGPGNVSSRDERQFGPDETRNYELGIKSTLMDGSLILNGALYLVEWTDPQVTSATVNASIPITVNGDGAESKGVELSANWQPTDRFKLRGSFSYVNSELTAPVPSLVRTISTPGFGTAFEDGQTGDRLPGSPEYQFSMFSSYAVPLPADREVRFNAGYSYQSDVLTRAGGRGNGLTLDGFGIANASVIYDAGNWTATFFVDNVLDKYAETGVISSPPFIQTVTDNDGGPVFVRSFATYVAPPRSIGLRFTWDILPG